MDRAAFSIRRVRDCVGTDYTGDVTESGVNDGLAHSNNGEGHYRCAPFIWQYRENIVVKTLHLILVFRHLHFRLSEDGFNAVNLSGDIKSGVAVSKAALQRQANCSALSFLWPILQIGRLWWFVGVGTLTLFVFIYSPTPLTSPSPLLKISAPFAWAKENNIWHSRYNVSMEIIPFFHPKKFSEF